MASTNKTTHLKLNQWISSDPILHTDFNDDNQRLDAAVHARALRRVEEKTLTAAAERMVLTPENQSIQGLTGLQLRLYPKTTEVGGAMLYFSVNGGTELPLVQGNASGTVGVVLELCFLPGGLGVYWRATGGKEGGGSTHAGVTAATLRSITFRCGAGSFAAGTQCHLYGLD